MRAPEIIGTLVGSSEKNLRDVFAPSIKDFEQMGKNMMSPVFLVFPLCFFTAATTITPSEIPQSEVGGG